MASGRVAGGLWAAERRALTIGLAATITFVAAEALAVVTVMPLVARDLHGLSLYGFVFSAFLLGTMVGIVAAGRAADKRGPAVPYVAGIIVFAAGLTIAGLAPSMPVLIAGRTLQGLGAGAIPAVAYVAIGRCLPEALRARMMAVLSTAWVVPGLAGPALSAEVAKYFGWRWVFLGLLPFVAVTGPVAIPALLRIGRDPAPDGEGQPHRLIDGIGVAVCAGLLLGGLTLAVGSATGQVSAASASALSLPRVLLGCLLTVAGLAVGVPVLRRLLPPGTLTARNGLPATILSRGLLTFCFFGADAFVTLAITILRHRSPVLAGVAVTGSTLSWTAGAWFQARMNSRWEGRRLIRIGLVIILIGIGGLSAMLDSGVAVEVGIAAWTVAGLGMGMSYAPTTLLMLADAPPGREGWASASLNLSDVLGGALGIGIGGAAISAAVRFGWSLAAGIGVAFVITAAAGVVCFAVTSRLPAGVQQSPSEIIDSGPDLRGCGQSAARTGAGGIGASTAETNTGDISMGNISRRDIKASGDVGELRVGHTDQVGRR
jgi:MFS family permease